MPDRCQRITFLTYVVRDIQKPNRGSLEDRLASLALVRTPISAPASFSIFVRLVVLSRAQGDIPGVAIGELARASIPRPVSIEGFF